MTRATRKPQGQFNTGNVNNTIDLYDAIQTAIDRNWISVTGSDTNIATANLVSTNDRNWSQGAFDASFTGDYVSFTMTNSGSGAINLSSSIIANDLAALSLINGSAARLTLQTDANNIRRVSADDVYALELSGTEAGVAYTYGFPNVTPTSDGNPYVITWTNGVPAFTAAGGGADGNGIYSGSGSLSGTTVVTGGAGHAMNFSLTNNVFVGTSTSNTANGPAASISSNALGTFSNAYGGTNPAAGDAAWASGEASLFDAFYQSSPLTSYGLIGTEHATNTNYKYYAALGISGRSSSTNTRPYMPTTGGQYRFEVTKVDTGTPFRFINVNLDGSGSNAISLYNGAYVLPNATPTSNSLDYKMVWNNGTPSFKYDANNDNTIASPIRTVSHSTNLKYAKIEHVTTAASTDLIPGYVPGDIAVDGAGMPLYYNLRGMVIDSTALITWPVADSAESLCSAGLEWDALGPELTFRLENNRANSVTFVLILEYAVA